MRANGLYEHAGGVGGDAEGGGERLLSWEMGLPVERSRAALYRQIKNEVTRLATETRTRPLLILDEAQWLRSDKLEEMRLTNYAMDSESRLCLLFCGQSELRRRVGMAVHEALSQRIVVRYHLPPLSRAGRPHEELLALSAPPQAHTTCALARSTHTSTLYFEYRRKNALAFALTS